MTNFTFYRAIFRTAIMTSTLPSDPSDISATAQALLQAHYGRLEQGSDSTATSLSTQKSELAKLEQATRNIDRICLQLDNLQVASQLRSGTTSSSQAARTLQPLGPLAFWPARVVQEQDELVFVRQDIEGLSIRDRLLLEDETLPVLTQRSNEGDKVSVSVKLTEPSRTLQVEYVGMRIRDAQMVLQGRKSAYITSATDLREKIAPQLRSSGPKSTEVGGKTDHVVNENNEVLNEEGLPFYEPVERITEEEATREKKTYMQPFVRADDQRNGDKEERRRWLDDVLRKFEEEEEREEITDDEMDSTQEESHLTPSSQLSPSADQETRVVLRTRTPSPPTSPDDIAKPRTLPEIVSATRPPPPKSALKPSAARPAMATRPRSAPAASGEDFSTSIRRAPERSRARIRGKTWKMTRTSQRRPRLQLQRGRREVIRQHR